MPLSEPDRRKLDDMLTCLCVGRLEAAETEQLIEWLEQPEVQDCFVDHAMLDAELRLLRKGREEIPLPAPAASPAQASPSRDRQGNFMRLGNFTAVFNALSILVAAVILSVGVVLVVFRGIHVHVDSSNVAKDGAPAQRGVENRRDENLPEGVPAVAPISPPSSSPSPSLGVARLTRVADCRWSGDSDIPQTGDSLAAGRDFQLTAGLAELSFDIGVRVVVQRRPISWSPAARSFFVRAR